MFTTIRTIRTTQTIQTSHTIKSILNILTIAAKAANFQNYFTSANISKPIDFVVPPCYNDRRSVKKEGLTNQSNSRQLASLLSLRFSKKYKHY